MMSMGSTNGFDTLATHQQTRLYASKSQQPNCNVTLSSSPTATNDFLQCALSGFLVDAP